MHLRFELVARWHIRKQTIIERQFMLLPKPVEPSEPKPKPLTQAQKYKALRTSQRKK